VIVFSEGHLWGLLAGSFQYSHRWHTHLSLAMDCPDARPVQPPEQGAGVTFLEVGGLHHHDEPLAA
jgi:putative transposase